MACGTGCNSNYSEKDEYTPVCSFPADNKTREKSFLANLDQVKTTRQTND